MSPITFYFIFIFDVNWQLCVTKQQKGNSSKEKWAEIQARQTWAGTSPTGSQDAEQQVPVRIRARDIAEDQIQSTNQPALL